MESPHSNRLDDFPVIIPRRSMDVYVNRFFPPIARLRNSLPAECFPLMYDLNGCMCSVNRHLLSLDSF